jgi:ribosomal-protein-alanine acetyltransferase
MKTRVLIRPFRMEEMGRILEIERASFGRDAYDRNLFAAYARHAKTIFLVAKRGRGIDGYAIAQWGQARAELASIAVDPGARGRGIATSLLRSTIRRLKLRGTRRLTLMVKVTNRAARTFYEGQGFTRVRVVRGYYEDGRDGVLMGRNL